MEVVYIHHSCFLVLTSSFSMVFDYWEDPASPEPAFPRFLESVSADTPLYVVVSHRHKDHYNPAIFGWMECHPDVRYILSGETAKFARRYLSADSLFKGPKVPESRVLVMNPGDVRKDGSVTVHAFGSTDCGCSWVIETPGTDGETLRIFHSGDLNAWIWIDESTQEEVKEAIDGFHKILADIRKGIGNVIDYCMMPVDSRIGSHWYMGAEIMVREFDVRHFFPMHFCLADTDDERRRRVEDACRFDLYANPDRGEYIALTTPYTGFRDAH